MGKPFPLPRLTSSPTSSRSKRQRFLLVAIVLITCFYFSRRHFHIEHREPFLPISPSKIQATFPPESPIEKSVRLDRQSQVKAAFEHAWRGYKKYAWLHDEIQPLSGGFADPFVGWAATLVDGLDTLWLMGMIDEFEEAVKAVGAIDFSKPNAERVPIFETTIRYLGGLLGAYDISGHKYPVLLKKATDLGDFLYRAFDTPHGLPVPYYWWQREVPEGEMLKGENGVLLAQIFLTLEFTRLSQITGDDKYAKAVQKITDDLERKQNATALPGMWPSQVDYRTATLKFSSKAFTLGAWAGKSICKRIFHRTETNNEGRLCLRVLAQDSSTTTTIHLSI